MHQRSLRSGASIAFLSFLACGVPKPPARTQSAPATSDPQKQVVGYFTSWGIYGRNYHVSDIPADKLTRINYAFLNLSPDGGCALGDTYADPMNFDQLKQLKAAHPSLSTSVSIGGWTWSAHFSDVSLTGASRAAFARSCVAMMAQYGFDGIDIDWEYPVGGGNDGNVNRPEDRQNYTLLLAALRNELDARAAVDGRSYQLTIAAPSGPSIIQHLELDKVGQVVDWINLMTYDFNGSWSAVTGFNAPLHASSSDPNPDPVAKAQNNASAAVDAYLAGGVPAAKLVLGVPFYGRGFQGVANVNDGLHQPFTGLPQGMFGAGIFDYHEIVDGALKTSTRHFDAEASVPWLYDPSSGVMISYDDPESMGKKADYVVQKGLGGVMFWELSGDTKDSALLVALDDHLTQASPPAPPPPPPIVVLPPPNPPPPPAPAPNAAVTFTRSSDWGDGMCGDVALTNQSDRAMTHWAVEFDLDPSMVITSLWDGALSTRGESFHVESTWNGDLGAGESASFGLCASGGDAPPKDLRLVP